MSQASHVHTVLAGIPFMDELEAAIRMSWAPDHLDDAFHTELLTLFQSVQLYVHSHPHCATLLEQVPGFAVDFAKFTLGIYKNIRPVSFIGSCVVCKDDVNIFSGLDRPGHHDRTIIRVNGEVRDEYCSYCAEEAVARFRRGNDPYHWRDCPECANFESG